MAQAGQWELRPYSSDGADLDLILRAAQPAVSVLVGCFVARMHVFVDFKVALRRRKGQKEKIRRCLFFCLSIFLLPLFFLRVKTRQRRLLALLSLSLFSFFSSVAFVLTAFIRTTIFLFFPAFSSPVATYEIRRLKKENFGRSRPREGQTFASSLGWLTRFQSSHSNSFSSLSVTPWPR